MILEFLLIVWNGMEIELTQVFFFWKTLSCFETRSHYVVIVSLEFAMYLGLASNPQ